MSTSVPWPILTLIALFGLAIGSFLNVVIYRVPRGESVAFPSSHCPHCNTPIKARHNVPVRGWLVLRGRCATCTAPISIRYPLVEAGTSALMVAMTMRLGLHAELPAFLFLAAIVVTLALIDFDLRALPNQLVLPAYAVAALLLMPAGAMTGSWAPAERGGIGLVAMMAIYLALHFADGHRFTTGDATLAGLLGLYLGWQSWGALMIGLLVGLVIGGLAAIARQQLGPRHRNASVANGPYIAVGACTALFVTVPLLAWYGALVGAS